MELRRLREDDLEQLWDLDADAFHTPAERCEPFLRWSDPADFHGLFEGGRLVATAGAYRMGQFFGGRPVPTGGVTSVAVAPDFRQNGCARQVLRAVLEDVRSRGEPIATLYPAATQLYRSLGFEVGGAHVLRTLEPRCLRELPRPEAGRVRPGSAGDLAAVSACYARVARGTGGFAERREKAWRMRAETWSERSVYLAENDAGEVEGYACYRQLDGPHSALGGSFEIAVDEVVTASRDAALALWGLLGSWASQVDRIVYPGPAEDPLLLLLPNQDVQVLAEVRWMTRVLDPAGAIEARGFSPGVEVEAHLALEDPLSPPASGPWVLRVSKGRGRLEPGGRGAIAVDVGAFSSLYTGWTGTAGLARAGRLRGGSDDERALLDAAFAGPTPWMLDVF